MYGLLGRRKKKSGNKDDRKTTLCNDQEQQRKKTKIKSRKKLQIESTNVVFKKLLLLRDLFCFL